MRYRDTYRKSAARILLAVFVAMLAVTSLHHHERMQSDVPECAQCAHHEAHPDHLTESITTIHDCLICQLTTVPFAQSHETCISAQVSTCTTLPETYIDSDEGLHIPGTPLRGPPVVA